MKVLQIPNIGFCFGVKRAIDIATQTVKGSKVPVYTYGPIIHNPQVVQQLEISGVHPIKSLDGIQPGKLIIRSHGVPIEVMAKAVRLGFDIIDATCPFVKHAQDYARSLCDEGYKVLVIGEHAHPEVQGIISHTHGRAQVVSPKVPISKFTRFKKLGIVVQTTLSQFDFTQVIANLLPKADEIRVYNTICKNVTQCQQATLKLANNVDLMIVVGGKNSANTTRLAELARNQGCETHHIETKDELQSKWFKGKSVIGVTSGASTPNWIVQAVISEIRTM